MYSYPKDMSLTKRFSHLLRFCIRRDAPPHEKNLMEVVGDFGLAHIERLPKKIWNFVGDPRGIAVFIWLLLELLISFLFYPTITLNWVDWVVSFIPDIPWWFVRISLYLLTVETILAYFLRAEGRLMNQSLMAGYREA